MYKALTWFYRCFCVSSFFIIKHPSPPIATHSSGNKDGVTAKIFCRLLCLLDRSNPAITIDNISNDDLKMIVNRHILIL